MPATPIQVVDVPSPVQDFSRCHIGIVAQLQASAELPVLVAAAARARETAAATVDLFERVVLPHHAEEEAELFPAVLRSATDAERETVRALAAALTADHRRIEAGWKQLEPALRRLARGQAATLDEQALGALLDAYLQHARTEESDYLPLAQTILLRDRNHMAALGVALHVRNAPEPIGYI